MYHFDGKKPLAVLVGATASGKSDIALELAREWKGEIISADSMQIYTGMDIGTAKPTPQERLAVPHHMIDILPPDQPFSVAQYQAMAREAIDCVRAAGRLPILCGGTGLYIDSILYPMDFTQTADDPELRAHLEAYAAEHGAEGLYALLKERDPATAQRLHPNDQKRIIRALEVLQRSGMPLSERRIDYHAMSGGQDLILLAISRPREELYYRVDLRVKRMMQDGLLQEVRGLLENGFFRELQSMQGLGYKELIGHLLDGTPLEQAVMLIQRGTRRLAKRQGTWFRREPRYHWHEIGQGESPRESAAALSRIIDEKLLEMGVRRDAL